MEDGLAESTFLTSVEVFESCEIGIRKLYIHRKCVINMRFVCFLRPVHH